MPDAHAVRASAAAAHPRVGTSRETTEVKKASHPTARSCTSETVWVCSSLRWFSHIKGFQTSPFDSSLCSGWEEFSPRWILPGPGGEGLSGHCATSPRTRGAQDDSGGQSSVASRRKETDFLWIIAFSEPQPRVGCARPLGQAAKLIRAGRARSWEVPGEPTREQKRFYQRIWPSCNFWSALL